MLAERGVSTALSANCHLPIAAHAHQTDDRITLQAVVGMPDGSKIIRASSTGSHDETIHITQNVIAELMDQGAANLISSLNQD